MSDFDGVFQQLDLEPGKAAADIGSLRYGAFLCERP